MSVTRVRASLRPVVIFSLSVTLTAALVSLGLWATHTGPFLLSFVLIRWSVVGLLLVTPAIAQMSRRHTMLPAVLRTPLTALVLTCESIVVDVVCARLSS